MEAPLATGREQRLERLASDAERARAFAESSKAAATLRAYRADWADFTAWCEGRSLTALPAEVSTVALYVASRSDALKLTTLTRRLSAINQAHKLAGHKAPARTSEEPLHSVWAGIVRAKTRRRKKATPVLLEDLRATIAEVPQDEVGQPTLLGKRDRALFLLGWSGALRRSELAALEVEDVRVGTDGLVISIRRSKTDQEGEGYLKGIPHGAHPQTCPVRALQAWLLASGVDRGPVFRGVDRHGNVSARGLSTDGVHRIIKRACQRVGLDASLYGGHSLRSGFITQAARAGKPERLIMKQSGHKDLKTLREYIHEGGLFQENAAQGLGL